jgi:hypothetical protein
MTAASRGPHLFSIFSNDEVLYQTRREAFVFSLLGQAAILGVIIYFTSCVIRSTPELARQVPKWSELPLIFSGHNGGGGGNRDPLPSSHGNIPRASLDPQISPPTVIVPKEMPRLPMEETVMVAPDIKLPQGGQIGDPTSQFSKILSNGPGGRGGIGPGSGCCC